MMKALNSGATEPAWEAVSAKLPCPVCGGEEGCRMHAEESFILCTQVRSEWPLTTGGWLHKDRPAQKTAREPSSGVYAAYDVCGARRALARRAVTPLFAVRGTGR